MATKTIVKYRNKPKAKRRAKKKFTIPITMAVPTAMVGIGAIQDFQKLGASEAGDRFLGHMTGFRVRPGNPSFMFERLKYGLLPIMAGMVAHKVAGKLGINKAMASAGIPIIRI